MYLVNIILQLVLHLIMKLILSVEPCIDNFAIKFIESSVQHLNNRHLTVFNDLIMQQSPTISLVTVH